MIVSPINSRLQQEIESCIQPYRESQLKQIVDSSGRPLAIKYIATRWAKTYATAGQSLKISTSPGYTWGTATYVVPICFPISSAIYGRIGIVGQYDPFRWRIFDATRVSARNLYLVWLQTQPLYAQLTLTMHANWANQFLRDQFRKTFQIDCVLFHPDQFNRSYTDQSDVWMAVSDWLPNGELDTGLSGRFKNCCFTILIEEEFDPDQFNIYLQEMIGPLSSRQPNAVIANAVAAAYSSSSIVRIEA